jgi:hypothetical protein
VAIDPFEELLLRAYPNPERKGCPGSQTLRALADGPGTFDDPRLQHIRQCSPCFGEFRVFRDARRDRERRRWLALVGSAAALAVLCLSGIWVIRQGTFGMNGSEGNTARAMMNFAATSPARGPSRGSDTPPAIQEYTREPLILSIGLPRGSESGSYEFELLQESNVVARGSGRATISRGLTTFSLRLDLSKLKAGAYDARVRHLPDGGWRDLMIQIR